MSEHRTPHINVTASHGMMALLTHDQIPSTVAVSFDDIEKVILQIQRDNASQKDDEVTLQVVKGCDRVLDILLMFKAEGEAVLAAHKNH